MTNLSPHSQKPGRTTIVIIGSLLVLVSDQVLKKFSLFRLALRSPVTEKKKHPWTGMTQTFCLSFYLSFKEPLLDFLDSHGGKQPFKGDCRNNEEVDNCFCRIEIDDRQLNALLRLLFSLSYGWQLGSCCTAEIFRASGSIQLHNEPSINKRKLCKFQKSLE